MDKEAGSFNTSVSELLNGLEGFVNSKTVVGEPIQVKDITIVPLVDMKFGIGAGEFSKDKGNKTAGGMGATINPCAVLVIQNGMTKLVSVKNQDFPSKIFDMVPDIVNRFTKKGAEDPEVKETVDDILNGDKK